MLRDFFKIFLSVILLSSCNGEFAAGEDFMQLVEQDLNKRAQQYSDSPYFEIFDKDNIPQQKREALQMLYAYMPLADLYNYPAELFEKSVDFTLSTRSSSSWGESVPDSIFMRYVLPLRVDSEPLDSTRYAMLGSLYSTVRGLSMEDSVLAVNLWCSQSAELSEDSHPALSPQTVVRAAIANEQELNILLVAALRTVGIPSRLVKSESWSQRDKRSYWCEVWIDGKWFALSASYPQPKLNTGWFNSPNQNGLALFSDSFGPLDSTVKILKRTPISSRELLTARYLKPRKLTLGVENSQKHRVDEYNIKLFGFAGARVIPIFEGENSSEAETVYADIAAWASHNSEWGISSIDSISAIHSQTSIGSQNSKRIVFEMNLNKPNNSSILIQKQISPAQDTSYIRSIEEAKKVQQQYVANFISDDDIRKIARELGYNYSDISKVIVHSRGNWDTIADILRYAAERDLRTSVMNLLSSIPSKLLYQASFDQLKSHLDHSPSSIYRSYRKDYILAPTVANEPISIYKEQFQREFGDEFRNRALKNPMVIVEWIRQNIKLNNDYNSSSTPILPLAAYTAKEADEHSRDILFVAICRSMGIPARFEPVNHIPQYFHQAAWNSVDFQSGRRGVATGRLNLRYRVQNGLKAPLYGKDFMLYKVEGKQLEAISFGLEESYRSPLGRTIMFSVGRYMLITSSLADEENRVRIEIFEIEKNNTTLVDLKFR